MTDSPCISAGGMSRNSSFCWLDKVVASRMVPSRFLRKRSAMCEHVGEERARRVSSLRDEFLERAEVQHIVVGDDEGVGGSRTLDPFQLVDFVESCKGIFGRQLNRVEVKLLCDCGHWQSGQVDIAEVVSLLICGYIYVREATAWRESLRKSFQGGDGASEVLQLLRGLNGGKQVQYKEVEWLMQMASASTTEKSESTTALLMAIAFWYTTPRAETANGLRREMVIARLQMELTFKYGFVRLLTLSLLMALLSCSLVLSAKTDLRRGIRDNLATVFELGKLADVRSISDVVEALRRFDKASARFSPLSPEYLHDSAEWLLQDETKNFDSPERLPQVDLWVGTGFSLQAWVSVDPRTGPPTNSVPILRRPLLGTGASCWSWTFPPGLAYGAQDFGGTSANTRTQQHEEFVEGNYTGYLAARTLVGGSPEIALPELSGLVLHTLVVNSTHVHFMEGPGITVSHVALRRPVTDCEARLQIGSQGLRLTAVRFLPKALSPQDVVEVFEVGATMSHIGYNIRGRLLPPRTSSVELADAIVEREEHLSDQATANTRSMEVSSSLAAFAVIDPSSSLISLGTLDLPVQRALDRVFPEDSWTLVSVPIYTDSSSAVSADGQAFPRLTDAGFTLSVWVKPTGPPGYLFGRAVANSFSRTGEPIWVGWVDFCYHAWVGAQGDRIYMTALDGHAAMEQVIGIEVSTGSEVPDEWRLRGMAYRHLVFRIDPTNSSSYVSICIDGACWGKHHKYRDSKGSPPADCETFPRWSNSVANQTKFFIARRPPNDLHYTGYIANMKHFARALSDAEVERLFLKDPDPEDPEGRPIRGLRGCKRPHEIADIVGERDDLGHDCFWYFRARKAGAPVCERSSWAKRNCQVACGLTEICWGVENPNADMSLWIWERQVDVYPIGRGGVTCVGKSTSAEKVAVDCGLSAREPRDCSALLGNRSGLLVCLGNVSWEIPNGLDCRDIVELHDPYCDWDDSLLDQLSAMARKNGEWAIQFWFESLETECPDPRIRILDGRGALMLWVAPGVNGGSRWDHKCGGTHSGKLFSSLGLSGADSRGPLARSAIVYKDASLLGVRHLAAFGVKHARRSESGTIQGLVGVQCDMQSNFDITGMEPIMPGQRFLRVINVVAPIRLSPLLLTPRFPSMAEVASMRYHSHDIQASKIGPSRPLRQQMTAPLRRKTARFSQKSILVSPPLVTQKRLRPGSCESEFSNTLVMEFANLGRQFGCSSPYSCESHRSSDVYQCPGLGEDGQFLGMEPVNFEDQWVHVEYLVTIAANKFLVRQVGGQQAVITTDDYVDTLTREVTVKALFYSVEFDIITVLTMSFDTSGGRVHAQSNLAHYVALTGETLRSFRALHYLIMLLLGAFALYRIFAMKGVLVPCFCTASRPEPRILLIIAWDCLIVLFILTYQITVLIEREGSEDTTSKSITDIIRIPWGTSTLSFLEKRAVYLRSLETVYSMQSGGARMESFAMALMTFLLLDIVLATGAHPRIAVLTSTMRQAFESLMHFGLIFLLVFSGFALIASWRFGEKREDLASFWAAIKTQFNALLSPPASLAFPEDGSLHLEYVLYVLLYHVLCFFFLMNFMLAIIIDAYAKTEKTTQNRHVAQSIPQDVIDLLRTSILKRRYRWPGRHKIVKHLQQKVSSELVDVRDLMPAGFQSESDVQAFCSFYGRFIGMVGAPEPEAQDATETLFMAVHELQHLSKRSHVKEQL
eukprot:TRINITY_DN9471_c0_g1_i1.p1 TRINITY_DN9471_c0_g1~~TRINITY_DN9471_c0_g1_i1.p1  ORF type:complete len:1719 (-),score=296.22 TRINITY_DN9471_c0_g1_i1:194-5329(-)